MGVICTRFRKMTTPSISSKKPAPSVPSFVPFQQSQSLEAEAKPANDTPGVLLEAFDLTIYLPDGNTTVASVDPSKPMIDLQIKICAQVKLNPADYTLQVFPPNSSWPIVYKPNQTFASVGVNNTVKLVSKQTEKDKQNSQRPFEITQRVIVSLPNNQRYVMRVRPDISLSELFKAATEHKDLDPLRYRLCHPTNPEMILNMDYSLNFYGLSEIYLAYSSVSRINGQPQMNSEYLKLESSNSELPATRSSDTMSRQSKATSWNQAKAVNGQTMQRNTSDTLSKSSEFLPGTNYEKKKGFFSFFRRKKRGKSSFGGSMQNLHQINGSSMLSLPKQSQEYPMTSDLQLHRKSLPTSSVEDVSTEAVTSHPLSMAPVVAAPKKRPAPQPPAFLLPLQSDAGSGLLIRPSPRLPRNPQARINGETQVSGKLVLQSEIVTELPEIEKSAHESVKVTYGNRHSPASSQSSGFEEMSPSPSEDYKKSDLNTPCSVVNTPSDCTVVQAGSLANSSASLPRPAPRAKRKAPPPPAVIQPFATVSATVNSTSSSNASISLSVTGPMVSTSFTNDGHSVDIANSLSQRSDLSEENSHLTEVVEEIDDENESTGDAEMLNGMKNQQSITAENDSDRESVEAKESDDEDTDAVAEEEEGDDYFCEMDAGYDGEIDFDNVDIVFVAPETVQSSQLGTKSKVDPGSSYTATGGQSVSVDTNSQETIRNISLSNSQLSSRLQTSRESNKLEPISQEVENTQIDGNGSTLSGLQNEPRVTVRGSRNYDQSHDARHSLAGTGLQDSEKPLDAREVKLCREPQTVSIDKSEISSASSNVHDICRNTTLEHNQFEEKEVHSGKTRSGEESLDVEARLMISDETREKLSNDSFLVDRSLCRRFYPSVTRSSENAGESNDARGEPITSVTCENTNENSNSNCRTNEEEVKNCTKEALKLQTDHGITSLRSLKSKPDAEKKSLYQLIKRSDSSRTTADQTDDIEDALDVCTNDGQAEAKRKKLPESPCAGETFNVELQRHLSRWQQLHRINSDELPTKSNGDSHSTLNINDTLSSKESAKPDLKGNSKTLQVGSENATSGSSPSNTGFGTKVSVGPSNGTKPFNKSDVVFTMDQLLAARSGLRKTTAAENLDEFQNNISIQKLPVMPNSDKNSSKPSSHVNSFASVPPSVSTVPQSPPSAFQNTDHMGPAVPPPPPLFGANQMEKRSEHVQNVAGKTLSSKPEPDQVDLHDQLLAAIRNAGGRPVKCKSEAV